MGASIAAFAGTGPTDVLARVAGSMPSAYRFNGTSFSLTSPLPSVRALWARSPTDAWAVGTGGAVARWNGTTWTPVESAASVDLLGVGGTATDGPWIVGNAGSLLKRR